MSLTFATVAEGPTDHAVLQNILLGLFKDQGVESGDIAPVQPPLDQTGRQMPGSPGGWLQVFRWLQEKTYHAAFQFNDIVVVQIDTGVCEESGFDIAKTVNGVEHPPEVLVAMVAAKLKAIIGDEDLAAYQGRFCFAIAVQDIECWLLPLWGRSQEKAATHNCKHRVDAGLARANKKVLKKDDVLTYASASSGFRKKARLQNAAKSQVSLGLFCQSLSQLIPPASGSTGLGA